MVQSRKHLLEVTGGRPSGWGALGPGTQRPALLGPALGVRLLNVFPALSPGRRANGRRAAGPLSRDPEPAGSGHRLLPLGSDHGRPVSAPGPQTGECPEFRVTVPVPPWAASRPDTEELPALGDQSLIGPLGSQHKQGS